MVLSRNLVINSARRKNANCIVATGSVFYRPEDRRQNVDVFLRTKNKHNKKVFQDLSSSNKDLHGGLYRADDRRAELAKHSVTLPKPPGVPTTEIVETPGVETPGVETPGVETIFQPVSVVVENTAPARLVDTNKIADATSSNNIALLGSNSAHLNVTQVETGIENNLPSTSVKIEQTTHGETSPIAFAPPDVQNANSSGVGAPQKVSNTEIVEMPFNRQQEQEQEKQTEINILHDLPPQRELAGEASGGPRTQLQAGEASGGPRRRRRLQAGEASGGPRTQLQAGEASGGPRTQRRAGEASGGPRTQLQAGEASGGPRAQLQAGEASGGPRRRRRLQAGEASGGPRRRLQAERPCYVRCLLPVQPDDHVNVRLVCVYKRDQELLVKASEVFKEEGESSQPFNFSRFNLQNSQRSNRFQARSTTNVTNSVNATTATSRRSADVYYQGIDPSPSLSRRGGFDDPSFTFFNAAYLVLPVALFLFAIVDRVYTSLSNRRKVTVKLKA